MRAGGNRGFYGWGGARFVTMLHRENEQSKPGSPGRITRDNPVPALNADPSSLLPSHRSSSPGVRRTTDTPPRPSSKERPSLLSKKNRRELALLLGVTLLFWLAAKLGLLFNDNGYLTPVWPPAAVACVAAILYGPASLIGAALYIAYDFLDGEIVEFGHDRWALVEPIAMLLAAAVCRAVAKKTHFDGRLDTLRAVMLMMGIGVLFAFVNGAGSTLGYCGLAGTQRCIAYGWSGYWVQSMIGDIFGCLICMPALLSWARWGDARLTRDPRAARTAPGARRRSAAKPSGCGRRASG